jgi:prepilin-type N-terminal cleavage/methylation domain-containing protein
MSMRNFTSEKGIHTHHVRTRGFTLIEMIVAMGVFSICMLLIVGSLISLNSASRKERAIRVAMDNMGAAMDSMSRNIRMGSQFHCGCGSAGTPPTAGDTTFPNGIRNCPASSGTGDRCMAYEGQDGSNTAVNDQIVYKLLNGQIWRSTNSGANYLAMTAPEINITKLTFFIDGADKGVNQPVVRIIMRGVAGSGAIATPFLVQTSVSARVPNFN